MDGSLLLSASSRFGIRISFNANGRNALRTLSMDLDTVDCETPIRSPQVLWKVPVAKNLKATSNIMSGDIVPVAKEIIIFCLKKLNSAYTPFACLKIMPFDPEEINL